MCSLVVMRRNVVKKKSMRLFPLRVALVSFVFDPGAALAAAGHPRDQAQGF